MQFESYFRARGLQTPSVAVLMTRGSYFDTRELHFGSFLDLRDRPVKPVKDFGSLSGKRCEKMSQIDLQLDLQMGRFSVHFQYFFFLRVLWRELGGHLFLGIFLAVLSGIPGSGIWS